MWKRATVITGFLFSLCICPLILPAAGANLGGYTVEPATEADIANAEPLETVLVPFWKLPPRIMLVAIVLSISPLLLFPLELLFLLKMFAFLGFRKLARKSVLDNPCRMSVYRFIRENPGVAFMDISRKTGVGHGTLRYHLAILKLMNKVTVLETTRNTRYFENAGCYSAIEQKLLKYLKTAPTKNILRLVMVNPDLTRVQLEQILNMSGAGVNWHMHRLSDEGLLKISKDGRNARYTISPDVVPYLKKYMPDYREFVVTAEGVTLDAAT